MKRCIEKFNAYSEKTRQWLWFLAIWFGSLIIFSSTVYGLKALFGLFLK